MNPKDIFIDRWTETMIQGTDEEFEMRLEELDRIWEDGSK